ncbi:galactose mutarotase-like protein, partial [Hysterangium stoloniferum]
PFNLTILSAPDGSINASFVPLGATLTELWVKDKTGVGRDVILGYDDNSMLLTDTFHPMFNPIIGRYAGRIKNGTFSIPITKFPQANASNVFHTPLNDFDGQTTLHGGTIGWDRRNWTVVSQSKTSVTFAHVDPADEGFPGTVIAQVTHTVSNGGVFHTYLKATASEKTPIMTTQHIYWNLDAFQGIEGQDILNHTLRVDSSRVPIDDGDLVPTGDILNTHGTVLDFRFPRKIGTKINQAVNVCGQGCTGYDNNFIYDHPADVVPGLSLWSENSGIRLDITTNQPAVEIFTAQFLNIPRKVIHGGPNLNYTTWAAIAIEQMGWEDAINTPEWHVDQIYSPGRDFHWSTTYRFSLV